VPEGRESIHGLRDVGAIRAFLTWPGIVAQQRTDRHAGQALLDRESKKKGAVFNDTPSAAR
jgi:hypothetical protein